MRAPEHATPVTVASAACHEPFAEAWTDLERSAEHAVIDVLRSGVDRHRELIDAVGLDAPAPEEWEERTRRLLEYRRALDSELLEPLVRTFEHRGPTAVVETRLQQAAERSVALCQELPETLVAPWPGDALARTPSDGLPRRLGKLLARVVSDARKAGRDRSVPLRATTGDHLTRVTLPDQDELCARAMRSWAEWSRRLEMTWIEWGRIALPALVQAELERDGPAEGEEEGERHDAWATIGAAARALQAGFESLLEEDPRAQLVTSARARLDAARAALEEDLSLAGSFLSRPRREAPEGRLRHTSDLAAAGKEWDEAVSARLQLYHSLLSVLSAATAVRERTVARVRKRCLGEVAELSAIAERLGEPLDELERLPPDQALQTFLATLDATVEEILAPARGVIPEPTAVDTAVRDISDSTVEALLAMTRQMPTELALHSITVEASDLRKTETRTLQLRELARQSFDALRIERIRASTLGLTEALADARASVTELDTVYAFARGEALRELESEQPESRQRALDLVQGALRSIAEALQTQRTKLETELVTAQVRLTAEVSDGATALLDRVGAGRMEAHLFAARSRAAALWAWVGDHWGPRFERASRWVRLRVARIRRLSGRLLRKGSAIVGSTAETAASSRTLKALADTDVLTKALPLVYQRLFTLDPISDRSLMAGRDTQLTDAMRRWKRWHDADGVPLIVRGRQGSGVTSFLNVLSGEIEQDGGSVVRCTLDERITDEADLAARLATPLGLPQADSLDCLTREIFRADPTSLPAVLVIDNLEHVYLRVPHGTNLIERVLTLMAETGPRLFWIGGVSTSAWQLVATAEPTAISQVDVLDLPPLTVDALHEAILVRHRRSGLAIRYEEPKAARRLLRRKLRRRGDKGGYRSVLEKDYFDQLHRASGGHFGLALWLWLMSADFESGDGVLMHQPEHPDFSILEALDLTQNFTLKALLEHRSLTLDEHDGIFRLPRHESYQIFESLRNRHVLEPVARNHQDGDERSDIEEELRYQVRPLLTGAVISHLQARNIIH